MALLAGGQRKGKLSVFLKGASRKEAAWPGLPLKSEASPALPCQKDCSRVHGAGSPPTPERVLEILFPDPPVGSTRVPSVTQGRCRKPGFRPCEAGRNVSQCAPECQDLVAGREQLSDRTLFGNRVPEFWGEKLSHQVAAQAS